MQRVLTGDADASGWSGWVARLLKIVRTGTVDDRLAAQDLLSRENLRLRKELERSREMLERAGRLSLLGKLAAAIAHEIRNPLVSVQTFFQLAPQRWHDEEFAGAFRELTEREVTRIGNLIAELLSFARSPERVMSEVELSELTEQTVRLLVPHAREHRLEIEFAAAGRSILIRACPDQLRQVLLNLILNAIEATSDGRITVCVRTTQRQERRLALVEVRDTGAGIPPDLLPDVFHPFFTTKPDGTGLGLSIAQEIVQSHGGFISVESALGTGSVFTVHLPAL